MAKGFLYILRNEAMPGLLKIGYSVKVPTERVDELFTTGVPEPFQLAYYCLVDDAKELEFSIHRNLSTFRHRGNREFFRIDLEAAVQAITSLCSPEYQWADDWTLSKEPSVAGESARAPVSEISVTSRHGIGSELEQMDSFVEAVHRRSMTPYVHSLFYDSNSCCCYFELSPVVEEYGPVAEELLEIALETIGQFEWFGRIQHGRDLDDEFDPLASEDP